MECEKITLFFLRLVAFSLSIPHSFFFFVCYDWGLLITSIHFSPDGFVTYYWGRVTMMQIVEKFKRLSSKVLFAHPKFAWTSITICLQNWDGKSEINFSLH